MTDMNAIIISFAVVLSLPLIHFVYKYISWIYRIWFVIGKAVNQLPGDPVKWPYGNLHQLPGFNEKTAPFLKEMVAKYNKVWRFWIGPLVPMVYLVHPDTIKDLVKTEEPKFTESTGGYNSVKPWLGEGLLLSRGQKWKRNRRLLTPAFHFDILKNYISVYNEEVETLINKWTKVSQKGSSFEIQADICLCTLSVILRCAFSYKENIQEAGENNPYAAAVLDMSRLIIARVLKPVARMSDFIYKLSSDGRTFFKHCDYVHNVAENVIAKRRKTLVEF